MNASHTFNKTKSLEMKRPKLHKITRKWPRLACVECPSAGLMLLRDSTAWVLHKPARAQKQKLTDREKWQICTRPSAITFPSQNISCWEIPDDWNSKEFVFLVPPQHCCTPVLAKRLQFIPTGICTFLQINAIIPFWEGNKKQKHSKTLLKKIRLKYTCKIPRKL